MASRLSPMYRSSAKGLASSARMAFRTQGFLKIGVQGLGV